MIPKTILDRIKFKRPQNRDRQEFPGVKEILYDAEPCDDCGIWVTDRRLEIIRYDEPKLHYRTRCKNCNLFRHPKTKKFSIPTQQATAFFRGFYRKDK